MPKAPRHNTNQVGSSSKRPAYQARSRARAPAPAPAAASASAPATATTSGPAPATATTSGLAPATATTSGLTTATATTSGHAPAAAFGHAPATTSGPSPTTASATSPASGVTPAPAPAPALVVVPAAPPAHRLLAAENKALTHTFGSRVIKMFFAIHAFITQPTFGAGPLTEERMDETAGIRQLSMMNKTIGCSYLSCGLAFSLWEFALVHDLQGYTRLGQYLSDYRASLTAADVDVGPATPEIQQVEAIIGYPFRNKRLIQEALTVPGNNVRPNYERLEFLGDAVLDVLAATAWIDRGAPLFQIHNKTEATVCNATLTVVGIEAGLDAFLRNCPQDKRDEISLTRISLATRRSNKVYWDKIDEVKALADVVEAVIGAVFLDSGLQLSAAEGVFRRILWPVVERRLA